MSRLLCLALIGLALACLSPDSVRAAGAEYERRGFDLILKVDCRWAGNSQGGYYPVRIRVTNRGLPRNLRFLCHSSGSGGFPSVSKSISVRQNETVQFTLSVPMVAQDSYAMLDVYANGQRLAELSQNISFADVNYGDVERPALLVISPVNIDCDFFEVAVTSMVSAERGSSHGYYASRTEDHQVVGPSMLPDSWLDYSGLDLVAVSLETLAQLTAENRSAILKWVDQGGTLLVYEVSTAPEQSSKLSGLLEIESRAAIGSNWHKADTSKRRIIAIEPEEEIFPGEQQEQKPQAEKAFSWNSSTETFAFRDLMAGRVYAFRENPFPGTPHDWDWFLQTVGAPRYKWTSRHGISARNGNSHFLQFLIPGVEGVPVYSFLLLITLFSIVIGPVNYFVLLRRKQLYMLVLTIPVLALVTSVSLFAYSAIAHGFGTKSRVRSVTWLDQQSQRAVSTSRVALYAGLAPSNGLKFSPDTAVFTIWPGDSSFSSGSVDWTDTQWFRSGWLRSRTRTQFLSTTVRDERGRLKIEKANDTELSVSNGLEWDLEQLIVADEKGNLFAGGKVSAGGSVQLKKASSADFQQLTTALNRHPLALPEGLDGNARYSIFGSRHRYAHGSHSVNSYYSRSISERTLHQIETANTNEKAIAPNSYVAILAESPDIDLGISRTSSRASLHVLVGDYR